MSKDHLKEEIIINESLTLELNSRGIDLLIHEDVPNESNSTLANKNVKYRKQVKEFPIKKGMPPSSEIKKEFHKLGTLLKKWSEGSFASGVLPLKMEAELLRVLADYKVPGAEAAAKRFAVQGALSSNSRLRKLIDYHYYQKFLELDDYEAIIENKDEFKALKSLVEQCAEIFSIYFSKKKFNKFQLAGNNCLIKDRKIIWLNISKESLKNFPQEILKLKNLKKLFLKWARRITFLPEEISELRELEWLKTFDCPFKELPESIGNLKKLKTLKIRDASLTSLPNSITHLTNLKILDISFNEIEQLPEEIGMLKNLKKLILNRNKFTEIPDSITNLKKLRVLSLFALRHLEKLPKNIGNLKNLRVLNLKLCYGLKRLPRSFKKLKSLRNLRLDDCGFKKIPKSVLGLRNLRWLNLARNSIKKFPKHANIKWNKLLRLKLKYNAIKTIPDSIKKLKRLNKLELGFNRLKKISNSISELKRLKIIEFSNNFHFNKLPEGLMKLKDLKILDAHANSIEAIPESIKNLKNLSELYLNHNKIKKIPESFGALKNLRKLNLSSNLITHLPKSLENLDNLEFFIIDDNPIKIPLGYFKKFERRETIFIHD